MFQLEKYQDDAISSVQEFYTACDKLADSKYLSAINKIAILLKSIVASSRLYTLFGKICNGFDLNTQIRNLRREDENGNIFIIPPEDNTRCSGFIFRLLMSIDNKENLDMFLIDNYGKLDTRYTFEQFSKQIIPAFKSSTMYLLNNENKINPIVDSVEIEEETDMQSSIQQVENALLYGDNIQIDRVEEIISQMIYSLQQANISRDIYNAFTLQIEDLLSAYKASDIDMINYRKQVFLNFSKQVGVMQLFDELVMELDRA